MSDNRITYDNKYIVARVSGTAIDNKILKRPYNNMPKPSNKKQKTPNSFKDTISIAASESLHDDPPAFSNELENIDRLKSEENSRLVQSRFNNNLNNTTITKNTGDTELQNKLREATRDVKVDVSDIYKKLQIIKDLKDK